MIWLLLSLATAADGSLAEKSQTSYEMMNCFKVEVRNLVRKTAQSDDEIARQVWKRCEKEILADAATDMPPEPGSGLSAEDGIEIARAAREAQLLAFITVVRSREDTAS